MRMADAPLHSAYQCVLKEPGRTTFTSVNLFYMWYNFCRVHQTLRVTPAMEAGISSHVWSVAEIVALMERHSIRLAA